MLAGGALGVVTGGMAHAIRAHFSALWERVRQQGYRVDPRLPAGEGLTTLEGDIVISPHGTFTERMRALLHEQVHSILTPRGSAQALRQQLRMAAYNRSHLVRYAEEALAEVVAQAGTGGSLWQGLAFPLQQGYVSGGRLIAEGLLTSSTVTGILYGIYEAIR